MQGQGLETDGLAPGPVREWFDATFPNGPTPAQKRAWPIVARGENLLLTAPTGTGKTLAAFLGVLEKLVGEACRGNAEAGIAVRLRIAAEKPGLRRRKQPRPPT